MGREPPIENNHYLTLVLLGWNGRLSAKSGPKLKLWFP